MIIAHVCNEAGLWVGEHAKSIASQWPEVRLAYYRWYRNRIRNDFSPGAVQFVVQSIRRFHLKIRIANMIAQPDPQKKIRNRAFEKCLVQVGRKARRIGASVHLAKMKADQTQSWPQIEELLKRTLCTNQIQVLVYCSDRNSD